MHRMHTSCRRNRARDSVCVCVRKEARTAIVLKNLACLAIAFAARDADCKAVVPVVGGGGQGLEGD